MPLGEEVLFAIFADKLATFVAGVITIAMSLYSLYFAKNWSAGKRLKNEGIEYTPFKYKGRMCKIMGGIGMLKTRLIDLNTMEISSPILNSILENETLWTKYDKNGNSAPHAIPKSSS